MKLITLFTILLSSLSAFAQSEIDISDIVSKGDLKKGKVCYNECKEKKKFFGVAGPKQDATDRKVCVQCLTAYPEFFTVKPEFLDEAGHFLDIEDESGKAKIRMGEACYEECLPKKEYIVVGKKQSSLDNPSCVPCLKKHSDKYKFNHSLLIELEVKCSISADKIYAYCNGDTYKLDSSINSLERSLGKDFSGPQPKDKATKTNASGQ